ncbi:MAG: thioredoxin domain-containing protein [Planctomycetes bacterium]|nr:thioredoxin domain-containing protein [Planctomycetota bacterium]
MRALPISFALTLSSFLAPAQERGHVPTAEELAKLPPDGGPEFNRLAFEKSPYLLQHARNPVKWFPWGPAAFEKASKEDKPIFLSIGYSTCHWCHVMEHESFEDAEVAALMNAHYVCIKVDREERPDVDQVYMSVTQAMTGSGGWPMTVVMTPDKKPFFAGTYFPKRGDQGRPGMMELLPRLAEAWKTERQGVVGHAEKIVAAMRESGAKTGGAALDVALLERAFLELEARFDAREGGFGGAPKFPTPHNLRFLLREHARGRSNALPLVELTLAKMARGGMHDQLGGGFHRYSTDRAWLVPHFEKMLYDQALLALAYQDAWVVTRKAEYREVAEDVLAYVQRELLSPEGGFLSAEDADSAGEEGQFYVWTPPELDGVLGAEEGAVFARIFGVHASGNAPDHEGRPTGKSILHLTADWPELARSTGIAEPELRKRMALARGKLFDAREKRVRPFKDDKVLTDWNGLAIAAFASAARAFDRPDHARTAHRAAEFVLTRLRDDKGRLLKRYRAGEAALPAVLDDYAFLVWGLLELHATELDPRWLAEALRLDAEMTARFADTANGGYFLSAADGEALFLRGKEFYDGALPSGNSIAASNSLRLAHLTGDPAHAERARKTLAAGSREITRSPSAFTQAMLALDFEVGPSSEVVISGAPEAEDTRALLREVRARFLPRTVVLLRAPGDDVPLLKLAPFTKELTRLDGHATAYFCRDFTCQAPTIDPAALGKLLDGR